MRNILLSPQLNLGQTYIGDIKINLDSRDDIPRILLGLQSVYEDKQACQEIEMVLASVLSDKTNKQRPQGHGYVASICPWSHAFKSQL